MTARLGPAERDGLNVAFNEATLLGVELDERRGLFAATLAVLSLPEGDAPPEADPRISVVLHGVSRLAASWRRARWDDATAEAVPLTVDELPGAVAAFGQLPIYGWSFVDAPDEQFADSHARLSLDVVLGTERLHTLDLFQETGNEYIALRVWFESMTIRRFVDGQLVDVPLPEVVAGGERWWDALYRGDPRTHSSGIVPG